LKGKYNTFVTFLLFCHFFLDPALNGNISGGKTASTPNFDMTIVVVQNNKIQIKDGGRPLYCKICTRYNSPINGPILMKLGCRITSCSRHVRHDAVAMATSDA